MMHYSILFEARDPERNIQGSVAKFFRLKDNLQFLVTG